MKKIHFVFLLSLMVILRIDQAHAQELKVQGVVTDAEGIALIGATVIVEGTSKGVSTNNNGRYELSVSSGSDHLTFSYIGYVPQTIRVGNRKIINIVLESDLLLMEEVVVTGYQTISKERATGSFSKLTSGEWEDKRITGVRDILEGRIAGYSNGIIRGITSFYAGTQPLYVVDGFPIT